MRLAIALGSRHLGLTWPNPSVGAVLVDESGETEIASEKIGHLVMEGLRGLDTVAYVRFASVYKNFREAKDFEEILGKLAEGESEENLPPPPRKKRAPSEQ